MLLKLVLLLRDVLLVYLVFIYLFISPDREFIPYFKIQIFPKCKGSDEFGIVFEH